jgi:hypothetical protein
MPARLLHVFPSEVHARFQRDTVLGRLHVNISPTKSLSFVNVLRAFVAAVACSIGQTVALLIVQTGEILGHSVIGSQRGGIWRSPFPTIVAYKALSTGGDL